MRAQPLAALIAATPRGAGPMLGVTSGTVAFGSASAPAQPADVWLVRYDPRTVEVAIKAGENQGRTLPHRNIVRELTRLGRWSGSAQSYKLSAAVPGLSTAVLAQSPQGGAILAAARG